MTDAANTTRWSARPIQAALARACAFLVPIAASVAFVHVASRLVPMPTSSLWFFLGWWVGLSALATGVLVAVERLSRRFLPLAALLRLSLVFPDRAPSRLRTALRSGSVETLEERIAKARAAGRYATPAKAAEFLLELVAALDHHDRLTRGHAERVRAYSQMIGEELHLGKRDRDLLNWSALLHDIGKLKVSSDILTKPGRLTDEEFAAIKGHPEFGEELVAPLREWLGTWADAVGDHHERWDGRGYPRGKAGEEITLGGRIVAVADVYDVITSARSYKDASNTAEARQELADHAGTQFDERIVRAFLAISLGRVRKAMGAASWLANASILGRVPLTPAVSSVSGTVAAVAAAVTTGLVAEPSPSRAESVTHHPAAATAPAPTPRPRPIAAKRPIEPPSPHPPAPKARPAPPGHPASVREASHVQSEVDEDWVLLIPLEGITGADDISSLRVSAPPHVGHATVLPEHKLSYVPPADYNGRTLLGYEVCWADGKCALGEVRITVRPVNDAPRAADDLVQTQEDVAVSLDVLANDSDVDGEPVRIASVSGESQGEAVVRDGRIRWSPPSDFHGTATFSYGVEDGQKATDRGQVSVEVAPINDAPTATPDAAVTREGVPIRIGVLVNDADRDGDTLIVTGTGTPQSGSVSYDDATVTYVPPPGFAGLTTFPYHASDRNGGQATGSVEVTVIGDNDAPAAVDDLAIALEDGEVSIDVLANDTDSNGDALSLASVSAPSSGAAAQDGNRIVFDAPGTGGPATVEYVVRDPGGATDVGRVTIDVLSVNDAPSFAAGPGQTVPEDAGPQTTPGWATGISAGPDDEGSQTVSFTVSTTNAGLFTPGGKPAVSAAGALSYTPAPNANGTATVTVRARDDGGTANGGIDMGPPQSLTIAVGAVNDVPSAVDDPVTLAEDSAGATFNVLANDTDVDGDTLSVSAHDASGVVEGSLSHAGGGQFTFVPPPGYHGSQTFSYTASDGSGGTDGGSVTLLVTSASDAPTAGDDAYATGRDTPLVRGAPGLLANDGDEDGDTVTVQATPVVAPSNGAVNLSPDGSFTYTPGPGFVGTDTFTYRAQDGTGLTEDAVVTITVSATAATSLLYLGTSGPSADIWDLLTSPAPAANPVPDFDGDGYPGLTIYSGSGNENEGDGAKYQTWAMPISPAPLVIDGPVALQLWSSSDDFDDDDDQRVHVRLYDCSTGGLSCVKIGQINQHVPNWNGGVSDWVYREVSFGNVTHTVSAGRELRVRVQSSQNDLWIAATAAYPSALELTTS